MRDRLERKQRRRNEKMHACANRSDVVKYTTKRSHKVNDHLEDISVRRGYVYKTIF